MHQTLLTIAIALIAPVAIAQSTETPPQKTANKKVQPKQGITKQAKVTIDGKEINYTVKASKIYLKNNKGANRASIFNVSYIKNDVADTSKRPVLFAFNGGPGSSAVWLHLGALGPKIVPSSPDGTKPLAANIRVQDNPLSILDVADLVFIDPVSTGFSNVEKSGKAQEFHGVHGDISSVGDFIRRWVTENNRWASPKFLLGESYGGVRAAGLSSHLQSRYGMNLNGVILLSSLLDFSTLKPSSGNDLSYLCFLPSLTATAHHHGLITGDRAAALKKCQLFIQNKYASALLKGNKLSDKEFDQIATTLTELTGLKKSIIVDSNLRISTSRFRKELLKSKGLILGRFDARVAWDSFNRDSNYPSFDPSFNVAKGPFSTAMLDYLVNDLGWKDEQPYEILSSKVHPWKWDKTNGYVNLAPKITSALQLNPKLKFLVQCGHTDLATPAGGILHSINHLTIPKSLRSNISVTWYDAGHMFYLNQADLKKSRIDLVKFITAASK